MTQKKQTICFARISVALVFIINIQCALSFLLFPEQSLSAYELSGTSGVIALQGLAIAFLMWNTTYPLVIVNPVKHLTLFAVVLAQQLIGLIGESYLFLHLGEGHSLLADSILRFIVFDALGFVLMGTAFIVLAHKNTRVKKCGKIQ